MHVQFELRWQIRLDEDATDVDPLVFKLLAGVRQGGSLSFATASAGVSYRHGWGLIRTWEARLGTQLLILQRGRGASLSAAGHTLLDTAAGVAEQTRGALAGAAEWATAHVAPVLAAPKRRLALVSSHSDLVYVLREVMAGRGVTVDLEILGSEGALRRYRRGDAELAGFHLPLGGLGRTVGRALIGFLDGRRDEIYMLEQRTLGLISRADHKCTQLDALSDGRWLFINRQPGSGTRLIFDGLLGTQGIPPGEIHGYGDEEYTHTAVAALVASAAADVGFGTRRAAADLGLHFEALVEERFYLVLRRELPRDIKAGLREFCAEHGQTPPALPAECLAPAVAHLRRIHQAWP